MNPYFPFRTGKQFAAAVVLGLIGWAILATIIINLPE